MNTVAESAAEVISVESEGTNQSSSTLVQSGQQLEQNCSNSNSCSSSFVPVNPLPMEYYNGTAIPPAPPPTGAVHTGGNEAQFLLSTSPASAYSYQPYYYPYSTLTMELSPNNFSSYHPAPPPPGPSMVPAPAPYLHQSMPGAPDQLIAAPATVISNVAAPPVTYLHPVNTSMASQATLQPPHIVLEPLSPPANQIQVYPSSGSQPESFCCHSPHQFQIGSQLTQTSDVNTCTNWSQNCYSNPNNNNNNCCSQNSNCSQEPHCSDYANSNSMIPNCKRIACSQKQQPNMCSSATREFSFPSNHFPGKWNRGPPPSSLQNRGYHSAMSCGNTTTGASSMDDITTSGAESCSCGGQSAKRNRRRARRKSGGNKNQMSSSESINQNQSSSSEQPGRVPGLIPLSIHRGPVLDLDSEDFPELGSPSRDMSQGSMFSTKTTPSIALSTSATESVSTSRSTVSLAVNHSRSFRTNSTPTTVRKVIRNQTTTTPNELKLSSDSRGKNKNSAASQTSPDQLSLPQHQSQMIASGWAKSGSVVLQTPYVPTRSIPIQTDFGTRLAFLTLVQFSPMYKKDGINSSGSINDKRKSTSLATNRHELNVPHGGGTPMVTVTTTGGGADNDSGYSSPKTRLAESSSMSGADGESGVIGCQYKENQRSIAVAVAPPIPAAQKNNQLVPTSALPKSAQLSSCNNGAPPVQQSRKKKKNASSRKKRGTLTNDTANNNNPTDTCTTSGKEDDDLDLFSQMEENFPALVGSGGVNRLSGGVTMGAGLQVTTTIKHQSATSWKPSQSSELHQAQLITHNSAKEEQPQSITTNDDDQEFPSLDAAQGVTGTSGVPANSASIGTPIAVSTTVSQSVKAKGLNSSKPMVDLPLTAFLKSSKDGHNSAKRTEEKKQLQHSHKGAKKNDKVVAVSDSEVMIGANLSGLKPTSGTQQIHGQTTDHITRPVKKGKQREVAKAKKPTPLKKVILQEREDRKKVRETYLINNEQPPRVVNQDTVLSMNETVNNNLGEIYYSTSEISEYFRDKETPLLQLPMRHSSTNADERNTATCNEDTENAVPRSEEYQDDEGASCFADESSCFQGDNGAAATTDDNCSQGGFSSGSMLSSILPTSTIPSRSGSAVTLFSLPEFPSACYTSDSDCARPATTNLTKVKIEVLPKIHSKKFREYCNQVVSKQVNAAAVDLLQKLLEFQAKAIAKVDAAKMKSKRRLVMGLREVKKHLSLEKLKLVIFSPNMEKVAAKGGLDEVLDELISLAREKDIPFVFALSRRELGIALKKHVPVSVVGVFSYQGAEESFNLLMELTESARSKYKDLVIQHQREQLEASNCEEELSMSREEQAQLPTSSLAPNELSSVYDEHKGIVLEHNSNHHRTNSFPDQLLNSVSCQEIVAESGLVSYQSNGISNHISPSNENNLDCSFCADVYQPNLEQTTVAGRVPDVHGVLGDNQSLEGSSISIKQNPEVIMEPNCASSLVSHQEITLNISISDAQPKAATNNEMPLDVNS